MHNINMKLKWSGLYWFASRINQGWVESYFCFLEANLCWRMNYSQFFQMDTIGTDPRYLYWSTFQGQTTALCRHPTTKCFLVNTSDVSHFDRIPKIPPPPPPAYKVKSSMPITPFALHYREINFYKLENIIHFN